MSAPHILFIGGFLGAGKTTLLFEAAKRLAARGERIGLITNDQAPALVDTAILERTGSAVSEVSGSCFCCNFPGLVAAIDTLTQRSKATIILAEPVGSCTDLSATILQPLKDCKGGDVTLAPLSVLVDPTRLSGILEGNSAGLHDSSAYIFRKQLEEADIILLSKADTLDTHTRHELGSRLASAYPQAKVFAVSAKSGQGMEAWLDDALTTADAGTHLATVDYDTYAEGEAVLGWLNATYHLKSISPVEWRAFAERLLGSLSDCFDNMKTAVGHVKLALETGDSLITANLVGSRDTLELHGEPMTCASVKLTLNARVQMSPQELEKIVRDQMQTICGSVIQAEPIAWRCLSPGRPNPTYRYPVVAQVSDQ